MNSFFIKIVVSVNILFAGVLFAGNVFAQSIERGPYLQQASDISMVVKWRTDSTTDSVVRYGLDPNNLFLSETIATSTTEHEVLLTGLSPSTKYYYSIGTTSGTLAGDSSYFFRTSPTPGSSEFSRFWVLGDSGQVGSNVNNVRDAYKTKFSGDDRADMVIMLGDNAYGTGTDSQYQSAMFDTFPEVLRQTPVWSTIGNHDINLNAAPFHSDPYFNIFTLPTLGESGGVPSGSEAYYSYNYANIHFVVLDSYSTDKSTSGAMLTWLANDLAANDKEWLIAYWHHPPYTKGSHDSDTEGDLIEMRTRAVPILESYGVDLVLSGHSHSYERTYLIDGHYGDSDSFSVNNMVDGGDGRADGDGEYIKPDSVAAANMGAVYVVAGSSSRITASNFGHEAMFISLTQLGSMVIDVNDKQLYAEFLNDSGQVADTFSIVKGEVVDTRSPIMLNANVINASTVEVEFNEPLEQTDATDVNNYSINFGISVLSANLTSNQRVVSLTVDPLVVDEVYTLTVNNLRDLAGNLIEQNSETQFTFNSVETRTYRSGEAPNSEYAGMLDSYLNSAQPTTNYGNSPDLFVDGNDDGASLVALLRWDISDIPAGSTVTGASLSLGINNPTNDSYPIFQVLKDWEENLVTWDSTGLSNWTSGGAQGSTDRGTIQLGVLAPSSTGEYVINLNSSGIQLVQDWVDGVTPNYGFLISSLSSNDGVDIFSSEAVGASNRPGFNVTFENNLSGSNLSPILLGVNVVNASMMQLEFNEPLEQISATDINNFSVNFGISVLSASLSNNQEVVTLVVEPLNSGVNYTLTVNNVQDLDLNAIEQNTETQFTYSVVETRDYRTGQAPNSSYQGMMDSYLNSGQATTNFGNSPDLFVDGNDLGADLVTLLRWDISDIPAGSTVTGASISLGITDPTNSSYPIFQVRKDWEENLVTWNSTGFSDWTIGGAQGAADRGTIQLGVLAPSNTGEYVVNLNASGLQLVQDWIDGITPNYGFLISNLIPTNGVDMYSRETLDISNRPGFSVTFENSPTGANLAPIVSAGADQTISGAGFVVLNGSAIDDGLPLPTSPLVVSWSKVSGPGSVSFFNGNSLVTTATFTQSGTYVLRLNASDGELNSTDNIIIIVEESDVVPTPSEGTQWLPAIYLLLLE